MRGKMKCLTCSMSRDPQRESIVISNVHVSHQMMYIVHDDKLFLAPVKNPQKVLDVGTGTGIWAM